jgi:hypothetical protein
MTNLPERLGFSWLSQVWSAPPMPRGIDLGDGRVLGAEDVLEGHFRRIAARPRRQTRKVAVQLNDSLIAKITVLAPDLAPLTELAEEVANALPPVQPASDFRANLHQALERTHRQYSAQRVLGTRRPPEPEQESRSLVMAALLLAALVLVGMVWRWWGRRGAQTAAA